MVKHALGSLFFVFFSLFSFSQTENANVGGRQAGMGYSSLTLEDIWSVHNNPAGTAYLQRFSVGIYYENKFLLKETGLSSLAFVAPLGGSSINFGFSHFGFSAFQKEKIALGISQKLFENFSLGLQADFYTLRQSLDYGNYYGMSFELGAIFKPTSNLSLGTYIANPVNVSYFADNSFKLPLCLRIGMSYIFSKKLLFALETGKSINGYTQALRTGIEYNLNDQFRLRGGLAIWPVEYTFGLGYYIKNMNFDFAYAFHQVLGSTPKLSLSYEF